MLAHTFNPVTWKADHFEFKASLVYIASLGQPGLNNKTLSHKKKKQKKEELGGLERWLNN